MLNQHVTVVPITFLTYQCQVWQFAQTLAFVQYSLPLVADRVWTVTGLTAQLDITALQQFAIHPAPRLRRLDCRSTWGSETGNVKKNTTKKTLSHASHIGAGISDSHVGALHSKHLDVAFNLYKRSLCFKVLPLINGFKFNNNKILNKKNFL